MLQRIPLSLVLAAVLMIASTPWGRADGTAGPPSSTPPGADKPGWTLTFDDEFDGNSLDTTKWSPEWQGGFHTHGGATELNYYSPDAVSVHDGSLYLTASATPQDGYQYTSGLVGTYGKFYQTYGWYEIKAKLPLGHGLWDGFWMKNESGKWPPEIDVFEFLGHDRIVMTHHWKDPATGQHEYSKLERKGMYTDTWHVYACDWEPNSITWYVDGQPVRTVSDHIPTDPMFVYINLAVDGRPFDTFDPSVPLPASMIIDYCRVYQKNQ